MRISLLTLSLLLLSSNLQARWGLPSFKERRKLHPLQLRPYQVKRYADHGKVDVISAQGKRARGLYITPFWLKRVGVEQTIRLLRRAHLDAVVLDIKDDYGHVLWRSKTALSAKVQWPIISDPKRMLRRFHEAGIYVIARLVAFKDSKLPFARPDLSMRLTYKPQRLFWAKEGWLDHYSPEVRDYLIDLALEWQAFGADEIQLDYIRFPKGRTGKYGLWLHQKNDKRTRAKLIADFLDRLDRALKLPLSVDVFGLTTLVDGDPRGLGQTLEQMAKHVEAISPMMYANGMTGYFKGNRLTENIYAILQCGLWRARQKTPQIVLRPYLQSYPDNVPFFGPKFIIKQVEAVERGGSDGFLFWNSSMKNRVLVQGLQTMGKKRLTAFGSDPKQHRRQRPPKWCKAPGTGNVFDPVPKKKKKRRSVRQHDRTLP